jgi:Ca2+-transporting ATPase
VAILYSILGTILDALTIFTIITVMVFSEVYNEWTAEQGVDSLKTLTAPTSLVLRDGKRREILSTDLVPGDMLELSGGERVSADARRVKAFGLQLDESSLTGESLPVLKDVEARVPEPAQTTDLANMVLAGTWVTQGEGVCVVTSTGKNTELGRVSELAKEAEEPETPLQVAIEELSKGLILIAVFFSLLIPVLGYIRGQPL